jgi:hypothetical protein
METMRNLLETSVLTGRNGTGVGSPGRHARSVDKAGAEPETDEGMAKIFPLASPDFCFDTTGFFPYTCGFVRGI